MAKMRLDAIKAILETIQGRYNGDNDTIPGAPSVLWADSQIAYALDGLAQHVEDLENRMDSHAHPIAHPKPITPDPATWNQPASPEPYALFTALSHLVDCIHPDSNGETYHLAGHVREALQETRAALAGKKHETPVCYVFVEGGVVLDVTESDGRSLLDSDRARVIDFDNLPDGTCPICLGCIPSPGRSYHPLPVCSCCGFDPEAEDRQASALAAARRYEAQFCPHCRAKLPCSCGHIPTIQKGE